MNAELEEILPTLLSDVAGAVTEWYCNDEFGFKLRTHVTANLGSLPDVLMDLRTVESRGSLPDEFDLPLRFEQVRFIYAELDLSFMVDNSDESAAHDTLVRCAARLSAVTGDPGTVLGEGTFVSPEIQTNFDTPIVEYADGTVGRFMEATCAFAFPYEV